MFRKADLSRNEVCQTKASCRETSLPIFRASYAQRLERRLRDPQLRAEKAWPAWAPCAANIGDAALNDIALESIACDVSPDDCASETEQMHAADPRGASSPCTNSFMRRVVGADAAAGAAVESKSTSSTKRQPSSPASVVLRGAPPNDGMHDVATLRSRSAPRSRPAVSAQTTGADNTTVSRRAFMNTTVLRAPATDSHLTDPQASVASLPRKPAVPSARSAHPRITFPPSTPVEPLHQRSGTPKIVRSNTPLRVPVVPQASPVVQPRGVLVSESRQQRSGTPKVVRSNTPSRVPVVPQASPVAQPRGVLDSESRQQRSGTPKVVRSNTPSRVPVAPQASPVAQPRGMLDSESRQRLRKAVGISSDSTRSGHVAQTGDAGAGDGRELVARRRAAQRSFSAPVSGRRVASKDGSATGRPASIERKTAVPGRHAHASSTRAQSPTTQRGRHPGDPDGNEQAVSSKAARPCAMSAAPSAPQIALVVAQATQAASNALAVAAPQFAPQARSALQDKMELRRSIVEQEFPKVLGESSDIPLEVKGGGSKVPASSPNQVQCFSIADPESDTDCNGNNQRFSFSLAESPIAKLVGSPEDHDGLGQCNELPGKSLVLGMPLDKASKQLQSAAIALRLLTRRRHTEYPGPVPSLDANAFANSDGLHTDKSLTRLLNSPLEFGTPRAGHLAQENLELREALEKATARISALEEEKQGFSDEGVFDLVNSLCGQAGGSPSRRSLPFVSALQGSSFSSPSPSPGGGEWPRLTIDRSESTELGQFAEVSPEAFDARVKDLQICLREAEVQSCALAQENNRLRAEMETCSVAGSALASPQHDCTNGSGHIGKIISTGVGCSPDGGRDSQVDGIVLLESDQDHSTLLGSGVDDGQAHNQDQLALVEDELRVLSPRQTTSEQSGLMPLNLGDEEAW